MKSIDKFQLLRIIVEDFIETSEPVGSENLINKYNLQCSSATIRNYMDQLEKEGYIEKQHISSGRVPSSKGYQFYLNNLDTNDLASSVDMEFQQMFKQVVNESTHTIEEALEKSCTLLSDMTKTAAIVLGQKLKDEKLVSLQVVKLDDNQALGILVTDSGHVEKKSLVLSLEEKINIDDVILSVKTLNDRLVGTKLTDLEEKASEIAPIIVKLYGNSGSFVINAFLETIIAYANKIEVYGKSNLLTSPEIIDDSNSIKQIKKTLDNPKNFEKCLSQNDDIGDGDVKVGFTNSNKGDLAVISKNLFGNDSIAVVGPRRMNYKKIISMLEYLSYVIEKKYSSNYNFNNLIPISDSVVKNDKKQEKKGAKKRK